MKARNDHGLSPQSAYFDTKRLPAVPQLTDPPELTALPATSEEDCTDTIRTPCSVSIGGATEASIESEGDVDWIRVSPTAGTPYRIETSTDLNDRDGLRYRYLEGIYGSGGSIYGIASGDSWFANIRLGDGSVPSTEAWSADYASDAEAFAYRAAATGEHFMAVKAFDDPTDTGYTVSLEEIEVDEVGDFADNTTTTCTFSVGTAITGYIEPGGDADWWSITLQAGTTYVIEVKGAGDATSTRDNPETIIGPAARLHNSSGTKVAEHHNIQEFSDGEANFNARITHLVPAGAEGTYYVSARNGEAQQGTYEITVRVSQ